MFENVYYLVTTCHTNLMIVYKQYEFCEKEVTIKQLSQQQAIQNVEATCK